MTEKKDTCTVEAIGNEQSSFPCGHTGPKWFAHDFWGERREIKPEIIIAGEKCGECWLAEMRKLIIRCARCGLPIYPGSGVVRYLNEPGASRDGVHKESGAALGCMRSNCCDSPFQLSGEWDGQKFVSKFGGMIADDGFGGGGYGGFSD